MNAYQVNKLCHRLYHDRSFRDAVKADPAKAIADWPLSAAERKALLEGDLKWLYEFGVHPFLLGHIPRWDLFGITPTARLGAVEDEQAGEIRLQPTLDQVGQQCLDHSGVFRRPGRPLALRV